MKLLVAAAALAVLSVSALATDAPRASCIDPHKSYVARPLSQHDVFAQTSLGKPKPPVRIRTTCVHLEHAFAVSLNSQFGCMSLGDDVIATAPGGQREFCKVARVVPYAPEEGDFKK